MIEVFDDFLTEDEQDFVMGYCELAPYYYGETDRDETPSTGMIHNIWMIEPEMKTLDKLVPFGTSVTCEEIYPKKFKDLFLKKITDLLPECTPERLMRMYINCFSPKDQPYFHTDSPPGHSTTTFLYYPDDYYDMEEGGETQFFNDGTLYGVPPLPNRLVAFPGEILHKATSFRSRYRFTVAIKYDFSDLDKENITENDE